MIFLIFNFTEILPSDCPIDWENYDNTSCIKFFKKIMNYNNAIIHCQESYNSGLVFIDSQAKHDFIANIYVDSYTLVKPYWIGLKDVVGDNSIASFQWFQKNKFLNETGFSIWLHNTTTSYKKQCVYIRDDKWSNVACGQNHKFICQLSNFYIRVCIF